MSALGRLGAELHDVDSYLEAERERLAYEWCWLKVDINLSRLQREFACSKDEESSASVKEARDCAFEEAEVADCQREAVENRERELLASKATLERQAQMREAALPASADWASVHEARLHTLEGLRTRWHWRRRSKAWSTSGWR